MKKFHFIVIIVFGIFLISGNAIACGKSSGKSTLKKEISSAKSEKKSCCNSDNSKDKDNKGCKGKCGHSECGCSSTCPTSSVSFLSDINFKNIMFGYSSIERVKFSYATQSILDGFYSVWLIPKIS